MKSLTIWIPGVPVGPNQRPKTTRARMALVKREREKAFVCALTAARQKWGAGTATFTGPARIVFEVRRRHQLDEMVNLPASLKHYQDGLCRAVLPLGDGPKAPYIWHKPIQIRVGRKDEEGVLVMIEEAEPEKGDPSNRRPFSGWPT
jgi:hypothetical protein